MRLTLIVRLAKNRLTLFAHVIDCRVTPDPVNENESH